MESRKAQFEAMQSSKQSDSERDFERDSAGNAKALSNPTTLARAAAPSADAGAAFAGVAEPEKACSSGDFERQEAEKVADIFVEMVGICRQTSDFPVTDILDEMEAQTAAGILNYSYGCFGVSWSPFAR